MILRFQTGTDEGVVSHLCAALQSEGVLVLRSPEQKRQVIALAGPLSMEMKEQALGTTGVEEVVERRGEWLRADRAFQDQPTLVNVGGVQIGSGKVAVMAGPCSVESEETMNDVARICRMAGAHILRGGAYKPRTSPYAFQGLGREGLRLLKEAGDAQGLPVISEIMDQTQLEAFLQYDIDCLQVGARNMQNFSLLKAIARAGKPVLLKRGLAATVAEWLSSAEYLLAHGCEQVVLCERGIRTFETATRNTLDLSVVPLLATWTHLPVVVDPSHATGKPDLIPPLSLAAIAAGAAGLAVEVHPHPERARSDGPQALLPGELAELIAKGRAIAAAAGYGFHRQLDLPA